VRRHTAQRESDGRAVHRRVARRVDRRPDKDGHRRCARLGADPTGDVLEGSTLGGGAFCSGGTIRDSHASLDPVVDPLGLLDRTFTCSDGTLRIVFTPAEMQNDTRAGTWMVVSGTGAYEKLRGSGTIDTEYDPANQSLPQETLTGTITR
jgi:hypothetical protein